MHTRLGQQEKILLLHLTKIGVFGLFNSAMSPKRKSPPLSKTDLAILSVLWREGTVTGRQVYDAMVASKDVPKTVAYTTVKTYLDRLIHKGYAKMKILDEPPGVYVYEAKITREEVMEQHEVLEHVVDSLHLTPSAMVRWFAGRGKLTSKDLGELRQFIDETKPSS